MRCGSGLHVRGIERESLTHRSDAKRGRTLLVACAVLIICSFATTVGIALSAKLETDFKTRFELPEDPKPLIHEILNRSEFKDQPSESLIERFRLLLWELARRAIKWIADRLPSSGVIRAPVGIDSTIVLGLFLGILALAVVFALWGAVRFVVARKRGRLLSFEPHGSTEIPCIESKKVRELARKLAAEGQYGQALIHTFRYVVLLLDETGRLAVSPGMTNGELLKNAREQELLRSILGQMVPLFNSVRYGDMPCTRVDYERFAALSHRVTEGI
jgi:hypothetical protein